ncbi:E3 ubiquitin-protein ligase TRIM71-like isoform X2 [Euwallacea fornicatus]|uniref:E3 ubiquitin-protein ligase TRIM71-like isoform X2 n=1 Tax=Euwallacea fornicatus TaxID=995702 RepID=UPI00338E1A85
MASSLSSGGIDDNIQALGDALNNEELKEVMPEAFPPSANDNLHADARQFFSNTNVSFDEASSPALTTSPKPLYPPVSGPFDPPFLQGFLVNCSGCRQTNKARAICYDCRIYLCEKCVSRHLRAGPTSLHTVYHFDALAERVSPRNNCRVGAPGDQFEQGPNSADAGSTSDGTGSTVNHHQTRVQPSTSRAVGAERRSGSEDGGSTETVSAGSTDDISVPESSCFGSFSESMTSLLTSSTDSNIFKNFFTAPQVVSLAESQVFPPFQLGPVKEVLGEPARMAHVSSVGHATSNLPPSQLTVCSLHQAEFKFSCSQCFELLCPACAFEKHKDHRLVYFSHNQNALTECTRRLLNEVQNLTARLDNITYDLHHTLNDIEYSTYLATMEIKNVFARVMEAVEKKKEDLLQKVEQIRQVKLSNTTLQMENVRKTSSDLADATALLINPKRFTNSWEHAAVNLQVSKTLHETKSIGELKPLEEAHVTFVGPAEQILQHISMWGQLRVNIPPQEKATLLLKRPKPDLSRSWLKSQNPVPWSMSRAIFGCESILTVKNYGETPTRVMGKAGSGPGELCRPWGIAINTMGQIVVVDRSNSRIQVFDPKGNFLFEFGSHGSGHGEFNRPAAVAVTPGNHLVVTDKDNHRVQVFSWRGEFMHTFGERGSNVGQFLYPWDVTCDTHGNILVSDTRNHRIQLFSWNGIFLDKFGDELNIPRLFDSPRGVTFDPHGNIMFTDFNMHRVVIIDRITRRVRYLGKVGSDEGYFNRPQGIICDDRGWFVVADSKNSRIQVFNNNGDFMWAVGHSGKVDPGEFDRPTDVALDPQGHIYVLDFGNNRIQIF